MDLWKHSHGIFMTQGNSRLAKRSFSEGQVLTVFQKLEVLNQTSNTLHK